MGVFIVKREDDGHYSVSLKVKGGHIMLNSLKHLSKSSCKEGIEIIRANASDNLKYEYKRRLTESSISGLNQFMVKYWGIVRFTKQRNTAMSELKL